MVETEETTSTIPFSSWFWKIWVIILSSLAIFVGSIHFLDLDGVQSLHSNIPLHLKPFRPLPIRIANYIGRFLKQTHLLNVILPLNEDTLIRDACKQLTFIGKEVCPLLSPNDIDEEWKVGLRVLLHSLETDAKLTLFGRFFATQQIGDALKRRALVSLISVPGVPFKRCVSFLVNGNHPSTYNSLLLGTNANSGTLTPPKKSF